MLSFNDLDLTKWKEYTDLITDSLWLFPSRAKGNGHQLEYHGNFIPQIPNQLIRRYTKKEDIVFDPFVGLGTTLLEARNLDRRAIGIDIQPWIIEHLSHVFGTNPYIKLICEDSNNKRANQLVKDSLEAFGEKYYQLLILHPPYHDIIKFSERKGELSQIKDYKKFLETFELTVYQWKELLEPGRYAALVIGDKYTNGQTIPMGFDCMQRMLYVGYKLKGIVVKNIENNEQISGNPNLWRYRALKNGFFVFKHEYIMVFTK